MRVDIVGDAAPWLGDVTHPPYLVAKQAMEVWRKHALNTA
jgi:hypothetical protein